MATSEELTRRCPECGKKMILQYNGNVSLIRGYEHRWYCGLHGFQGKIMFLREESIGDLAYKRWQAVNEGDE